MLLRYFYSKTRLERVIVLFSSVLFIFGLYFLIAPQSVDINHYYEILNQKDNLTRATTTATSSITFDLKYLDKCKISNVGNSSEKCYKDFFEQYTRQHGPDRGLQVLKELINTDATIIPGCHYISHGIGAGALSYFNNNVARAYTFDVARIFSNLGSCGNGYYHGVSIGMTEEAKTDDELYNIIYGFCAKRINNEDLGEEACNHGIGHALTLYYDHNLEKSVAMCHRLFTGPTKDGFFGCMTGVRMEYGIYLDFTGLWEEKGASGILNLCKDYPYNTDEREACIVEGSGVVRYGEDYVGAVVACQTLPTATDRKACTKLTVIHAIRLGRSEQVLKLCKIPKRLTERIECTSFFANYLSISVDINRREKFFETTKDICHTLNIFLYPKCIAQTFDPYVVTFRSHLERGVLLTWQDLKNLFYFYRADYRGCVRCGKKLINEEAWNTRM